MISNFLKIQGQGHKPIYLKKNIKIIFLKLFLSIKYLKLTNLTAFSLDNENRLIVLVINLNSKFTTFKRS